MPREGLSAIHAKALARISDLKLEDKGVEDMRCLCLCVYRAHGSLQEVDSHAERNTQFPLWDLFWQSAGLPSAHLPPDHGHSVPGLTPEGSRHTVWGKGKGEIGNSG
jgi:hypothetical protein